MPRIPSPPAWRRRPAAGRARGRPRASSLPTGARSRRSARSSGAVATPPGGRRPRVPPPLDARFAYERPTDRDGRGPGASCSRRSRRELTGYVWPLTRGRITLPFKAIPGGTRIKDGKLFHDGVDMATFCGDTVRAAHDGVVLAAGRHFDDYVGWIGDLGPYYRVPRQEEALGRPAERRRHRRRQRLPQHLRPHEQGHGQGRPTRQGRPADRARGRTGHASGCHVHYGLFSPLETKTFGVRADILKRLRVPTLEIARIDPLLVLPGGAEALRTRQIPRPAKAPDDARQSLTRGRLSRARRAVRPLRHVAALPYRGRHDDDHDCPVHHRPPRRGRRRGRPGLPRLRPAVAVRRPAARGRDGRRSPPLRSRARTSRRSADHCRGLAPAGPPLRVPVV